jgi:integrase
LFQWEQESPLEQGKGFMVRRVAGEGSIFKRSDGRWVGTLDLGPDAGGKRARKTIYGKSQREVRDKLAQVRREIAENGQPSDGRLTLGQFLQDWLTSKRSQVRPRTWARYESYCRLHVEPRLGKVRLAKVTPEHLEKLYSQLLDAGLAPMSVRHLHAMLHGALKHGVRRGVIARNVTELVDPPLAPKHEIRTLSADEAQRLLQEAADDPLEALYVLAITTGMRQGELLALRWRDVDLRNGALQVRGTLQRGANNELEIREPKTNASTRRILLPQLAVDALARHTTRQRAQRERAGTAWDDLGLVFTNEIGRPINASNLTSRSFRPLLKRARIEGLRFHDLRHSAATLLLEQNVHPKVVSEMLGHADIGITLDLYSHVTPTMQAHAASAFDDLLGPRADLVAVNVAVNEVVEGA